MRPSDVNPNDWPLYYNGTFMYHVAEGLVQVQCDDELMHIRGRGGEWVEANVNLLDPIWPPSRAINLGGHAAHIGRRARREARRSATAHHYVVEWSNRWSGITYDVMNQLLSPDPYPAPEDAIRLLLDSTMSTQSIAVSRDLILVRHPNSILGVICRGISAGTLQAGSGRYEFIPEIPESPVARRVQFKLQKEGVLCLSL